VVSGERVSDAIDIPPPIADNPSSSNATTVSDRPGPSTAEVPEGRTNVNPRSRQVEGPVDQRVKEFERIAAA